MCRKSLGESCERRVSNHKSRVACESGIKLVNVIVRVVSPLLLI